MKRIIDWVLGFTAITAVLAVTAICYAALEEKRGKLTVLKARFERQGQALEAGNQERAYLTSMLADTDAALQLTCAEAQRAQVAAQTLDTRLQTTQQLAGLLECEVDRLRPLRTVTAIIVHHSVSTFGDVPTIDGWHRERGFSQVGYHYVICNGNGGGEDGEIQFARDEDVQGAHAKANHRNEGTLGICLIGTNVFTPAQLRSLQLLLHHLCRRHRLTPGPNTIQTHHEQCPGPGLNLDAVIASAAGNIVRS